jgi:hypothetical protein
MARPVAREVKVIDWILYLWCTKCKSIKDFSHFNTCKSFVWYRSVCRECLKQYRISNKEYIHNRDKEYYREHREERRQYNKMYRQKNKDKLSEYDKQKRIKWWYVNIHNRTRAFVKKYNIKHDTCCICWSHIKIELHHPDYNKRNEVCIVCNWCHKEIHSWYRVCPKPINLLDIKK